MDVADRLKLDVPVGQAGMGGGLAGAPLAAAVAKAGGLGTLGLPRPPSCESPSIRCATKPRARRRSKPVVALHPSPPRARLRRSSHRRRGAGLRR
ncbi:nitronate monooxygenase family protein [Mycobacterium xenopi 3993]|nr:nitronate monooxygenase family protein [Mycobacterium xenopi 3993]